MGKELEHTGRATYVGLEGALSSPSPSWAGGFDDGLIEEILSRLPVKSLVRFRCVCKSWLALTSDPKFARKHASKAGSRLKLLETINPTRSIDFRAILDDDDRVDYTVLTEVPSLCVLGSCNGLICLKEVGLICREEVDDGLLQEDEEEEEGEEKEDKEKDEEEEEEGEKEKQEKVNEEEEDEEENNDDRDLIIWNPSTQDTYKLPKITIKCNFGGFGYDSTNEDYKVIIGSNYCESGIDWETESDCETEIRTSKPPTATLAVFTLKTGSWKIVENLNNVGKCRGAGRLMNGALHWLEYSYLRFTIISFDLAEEKFQALLPPPDVCTTESTIHLEIGTTIGNSLFLYLYDYGCHESQTGIAITIWVMKEYGVKESWTKVVQIPSLSLSPSLQFDYRPTWILENGKVLMNRISHSGGWEQLVLYDPEENSQKEYRRLLHDYHISPVLYLESLVSPKVGS